MFLASEMAGLSLPQIGRAMGGFDHTTILHGRNKIKAKITADPVVADAVDKLRKELSLNIAERIALAKAELDRLQRIASENSALPILTEGLSP
jgi:hypothetical protein